ncbi:hypothetical protein BC829DRAFT_480699 [Chytridium lagenaria]|nr:hypothetical protein BC829DRAFT_480699 [Chytridium lagenaria]
MTDKPPLPAILLADCISAILTAASVAPAVAIIDRSIIANVSGKQPLLDGLKEGFHTLLTKPWLVARQPSVMAVFCVYGSTYLFANTVESLCIHDQKDPAIPKFIASSVTNITGTIWKDRLLTRWFGNTAPRPLPFGSYILFGSRDALTMAASFTLPPLLSQKLTTSTPLSKRTTDVIAQLFLPCAFQLVSTPIHLLGLDLYNRPEGGDRFGKVRSGYVSATVARMGRILPAFGVGGVVNRGCRGGLEGCLGVEGWKVEGGRGLWR